jgi:hypothetical protein
MIAIRARCTSGICWIGAVAGIAGGVSEILWLGFYGAASGHDTTELARNIATVIGVIIPVAPVLSAPVASGLAIHMFAAVALGIALAFAWCALSHRRRVEGDEYRLLPAALVIIWGFNFFVLLPLISPYFADLHRNFTEVVPYSVSLLSKLLFGTAVAAVFTLAKKTRTHPVLVPV